MSGTTELDRKFTKNSNISGESYQYFSILLEHIGVKLEASLKGEEIGYNDDDLDMDYYDRVTRLQKF